MRVCVTATAYLVPKSRMESTVVDPLAGIEAKLDRAAEHVEEFEAECRTFLDSEPWSIVQEFDENSRFHVGHFRIWREPPLKLGVIAGEAVGQCRSALDHLMAVAVRLGRPDLLKPPNFPIVHDADRWTNEKNGRRLLLEKLLRADQLTAVERLQPCKRKLWPRADSLRLMQAFNNFDKHDALLPAYIQAAVLWRARIPDPNIEAVRLLPSGLFGLVDGTELYSVRFHDQADVYVAFGMNVEIAVPFPQTESFREGPIVLDTLRAVVAYTHATVQDFRDVTPEFGTATRAPTPSRP